MPDTPRAALLINRNMAQRVFGQDARSVLEPYVCSSAWDALPETVEKAWMIEAAKGADAVITCWGTPKIDGDVLSSAQGLRLIAHAAGSPRAVVTDGVFKRGIRVFTAAPVIADDVAETTVGLLIIALKRLTAMQADVRSGMWKDERHREGLYRLRGLRVGVISASLVGRKTIELLRMFGCDILLYDPFVTAEAAAALGANKTSLEEMFATCRAVCVHAPNLPETHHMVSRDLLLSMPDHAVLINNARGPIVDEGALIDVLQTRPIFACLDVTDPEPPAADNKLRALPNVMLTPHMAGGQTMNGRLEQGLFVAEQTAAFFEGKKLVYEVTEAMMPTIA